MSVKTEEPPSTCEEGGVSEGERGGRGTRGGKNETRTRGHKERLFKKSIGSK